LESVIVLETVKYIEKGCAPVIEIHG